MRPHMNTITVSWDPHAPHEHTQEQLKSILQEYQQVYAVVAEPLRYYVSDVEVSNGEVTITCDIITCDIITYDSRDTHITVPNVKLSLDDLRDLFNGKPSSARLIVDRTREQILRIIDEVISDWRGEADVPMLP